MPRPENPLDPASGPVEAFAVALRRLRSSAGTPSYRAMAARSFYGHTTLAAAAAGQRFPSWEITRAYVAVCGGDVHEWELRWRETAEIVKSQPGSEGGGRSPPARMPVESAREPGRSVAAVDPTQARTFPELMGLLEQLCSQAGLSRRRVVDRSHDDSGYGPTTTALAPTTVSEFLRGVREPRLHDVLRIVALCGATPSDLQAWATTCQHLLPTSYDTPPVAVGRPHHQAGSDPAQVFTRPPAGRPSLASAKPDTGELLNRIGGVVQRIQLGARLRQLREMKDITRDEAGYAIRASHSKISRLELGRVGVKERDVADLLTLYGLAEGEERDALLALARQANMPGWWLHYSDVLPSWFELYIGLEEAAAAIRTYEVRFIPELLQTEGYARALIMLRHPDASPGEIARRVDLLMCRQQLLTRPDAARLWVVVDEAALCRPLGGPAVMRAQLEHLIAVASFPNVTVQIMPSDRSGHAAAGGSFSILRFAEPDLPDVVYLEHLAGGLYIDKPADSYIYRQVMDRLSISACLPDDAVRVLAAVLRDPGLT